MFYVKTERNLKNLAVLAYSPQFIISMRPVKRNEEKSLRRAHYKLFPRFLLAQKGGANPRRTGRGSPGRLAGEYLLNNVFGK